MNKKLIVAYLDKAHNFLREIVNDVKIFGREPSEEEIRDAIDEAENWIGKAESLLNSENENSSKSYPK